MIAKLMTLVMAASILSSAMVYAADEGETTQVDASSGPATPAQPSVTSDGVASNPEVGAAAQTAPAKGKREIARRRHKRKHHKKHRRGRH